MAKTIDYKSFHVAICPYKVDGCKNEYNDLSVGVRYVKGKGFMVDYMPGWYYNGVGGCIFDYSDNPLTAGKRYLVQAAGKNNTKLLLSMYDNLSTDTATKIISYLFSQHDWNALAVALKTIALDATWATEARLNAMVSEGGSVMQRMWRNAKKAYPDYVMLFQCGDFYEAYEDDAVVLGKVLGITVTKHKGDYTMAGFPRHALDVYLKKMIVANYRVAICDRLASPEHMNVQELVAPSAINNNSNSNNNSTTSNNSTTMAKNVKGADLIGKTLVGKGNSFTYKIESENGDVIACTYTRGGTSMKVNLRTKDIDDMTSKGVAAWQDEPTAEQPKAETKGFTKVDGYTVKDDKGEDVKFGTYAPNIDPDAPTDNVKVADFEEVDATDGEDKVVKKSSIVVDMTGKQTTEPIHEQPKAEPVNEQPINEPKAEESKPKTKKSAGKKSGGKYTFTTYKTKKGKEGGEIRGFAEDDDIYSLPAETILTLHASKTWRKDKKGNKTYCLLFGPRYKDAAEQVCEALNNGAGFDEVKAIVDGRTAERAAKREEWKAKRAEYIANREAKANEPKTAKTSDKTSDKATEEPIGKQDIAGIGEFLRKVMAGDKSAMALAEKLMNAA